MDVADVAEVVEDIQTGDASGGRAAEVLDGTEPSWDTTSDQPKLVASYAGSVDDGQTAGDTGQQLVSPAPLDGDRNGDQFSGDAPTVAVVSPRSSNGLLTPDIPLQPAEHVDPEEEEQLELSNQTTATEQGDIDCSVPELHQDQEDEKHEEPASAESAAVQDDGQSEQYALPAHLQEATAETVRSVQGTTLEQTTPAQGNSPEEEVIRDPVIDITPGQTSSHDALAESEKQGESCESKQPTSQQESVCQSVDSSTTSLPEKESSAIEENTVSEDQSLTAQALPEEVRMAVSKALEKTCQKMLVAESFLRITGELNFCIDDHSLMQMEVSQLVHYYQSLVVAEQKQRPARKRGRPRKSTTLSQKEANSRAEDSADTEDYDDWKPYLRRRTKQTGRGARSSLRKVDSANVQDTFTTLYDCQQCSYTTKHIGFFKKHQRTKHGQKKMHKQSGHHTRAATTPPDDSKLGNNSIEGENPKQGEEASDGNNGDGREDESESDNEDKDSTYQPEEHEAKQVESSVAGRFKCDKCPYETDHSGHYRDHQNRHMGVKPYNCTDCAKSFTTADDLKRHVSIHHRKYECAVCSEEFYERATLKAHMKEVHGQMGRLLLFPCEVCKKNWPTQAEMEKHVEAKHNHICSVCGEHFTLYNVFKKHQEKEHPEQALTCNTCGKKCATKGALRKHLHRHRAGNSFPCDLCGRTFTAQSTLYHHKRGVHSDLKPYKCERCDKAFNFHHSLKLHMLQHKGLRPYKCDICSKTYLTATHLKSHKQAVHDEDKKYVCVICNKRFPYENSLKMHVMLHTGNRPFLCNLCGRGFVTHSALKTHEASHVESKEFQCDLCKKHYKTEALLRAHRRRHTDEGSRFMCDICGHTFMYKSNLEAHAMVHSDERKYTCSECNSTFKTYATLYSHRLVHKTDTPYSCTICCKAFKSKERKIAHEKRHLGEKPFQCEICGRSFPDKGGLSKHGKTVHAKRKRFGCPVCKKTCSRADNLRVHMRVHRDPSLLSLSYKSLLVDDETDAFMESHPEDSQPATSQQQQQQQQQPQQQQQQQQPQQVILSTPEVPASHGSQGAMPSAVARGSGGSSATLIGALGQPHQQLHHPFYLQPAAAAAHPGLAPPPAHHQHHPAIQTPGFDSALISPAPENLVRAVPVVIPAPDGGRGGDGSLDGSMPQTMRDYTEMYLQYQHHQQQHQQQQES